MGWQTHELTVVDSQYFTYRQPFYNNEHIPQM